MIKIGYLYIFDDVRNIFLLIRFKINFILYLFLLLMIRVGKIIGLLILSSLILLVSSKNYEFEVTYECVNNEYKWFE